jgi:hypothetical protein
VSRPDLHSPKCEEGKFCELRPLRRALGKASGRFRTPSQRVKAERFGLFGGEDDGHLRGALARLAAYRDLQTAVGEIL